MFQAPVNEFQILLKAFSYFKTHWWLFVLEVATLFATSFHGYYRTAPVYESYAALLIDTSRRQLYQSVLMPSFANIGSNARKQNMAHLLTSQEVMDRFRNMFSDHYNTEGRPPHLHSYFPSGVCIPAESLKAAVSLNWDKNSDIYNIRCTSESPDAAHDLCLAYMNTIQTYYPEIGQREAMLKKDFLGRQISSLTRQIAEREANLAEFQKRSQDFLDYVSIEAEDGVKGTGQGITRIRDTVTQTKRKIATNRAVKQILLTSPQATRGEHTAYTTAITALSARLSDLRYQLNLTEASDDPDKELRIRNLNAEVQNVTDQLGKLNQEDSEAYMKSPLPVTEVRRRISDLELEYRTETITLEGLEREMNDFNQREKKYMPQKLEYERLKEELTHKRRLLTNLYSKEQETELELSAGNAEIFRLVEPTRNGQRVSPQFSKYFYGALSFSIFLVIITSIILMAFFPRLDSEAEVNRLNLPVLGKVPVMKGHTHTSEDIPGFGLEYLKIMNYRILRETKDIKCPVIIVSSPHAREGKSTVCQLLTMASQSPSRRTLLIDGDLLTSHPNAFFGISHDQTPGAKAILEGFQGPWSDLIVKTMHEGISLMPRGERIEPSALPNFLDPMKAALVQLRREYDIIFIDTPPLFAANLSHQWSGIGDLIVLVARIYTTRPKDIAEALQTCKIFSKSPVGIALNCVPLTGPIKRASNYYFTKKKTRPTRMAA